MLTNGAKNDDQLNAIEPPVKPEVYQPENILRSQSFLVKFRELVKRVVTSRTTYSVIGALGSITAGAITVALFCGASFCAPMIPAIIGLVAAGISLIGMIIDVIDRATDERQYDTERNIALGTQILGKIGFIAASAVSTFVPVVGQVLIFTKILSYMHSAIGIMGFCVELTNDHRNNWILAEYGDNKLGHALKWFLDLLFGVPGQPPQTITSPADDEPGKIESN